MRMNSVVCVSGIPWEDLLLAGRRGGSVYPVALQLVDLPIIRAVQKLEVAETPDGRLPIEAYTAELSGRRPDGSPYKVLVKGDDHHGLPYGADGDIFFALFKIADEMIDPVRANLFSTGEFADPTVGMIARAMGRPMNGETSRRIREALHRLSHVRIEMHINQRAADIGLALLNNESTGESVNNTQAGGAELHLQPAEPDGSPVPRPRKGADTIGVLHVLEYAVKRTYDRRDDGEDWIAHLQINPVWLRELAGGWAAWINVDHYVALRSPIAKRLYQLFAGESARGVATPWVVELRDLQNRCGMAGVSRRPAAVRVSVEEAATELVNCDVLSGVQCEKVSRGRYVFTFVPGLQLQLAALLRGVGALDVRELRIQRMLLRHFGVTRENTDRILAERPSRVQEALQYLLYVRDIDHARVKRSWSAYLLKLVDGDANFSGDVRYQQWLARRRRGAVNWPGNSSLSGVQDADEHQGMAESEIIRPRVLGDIALVPPLPRVPLIDAARTAAISADAAELWTAVRLTAAARYPSTHAVYVEDLAAFDLVDDTLTCVTATAFTLQMLERAGLLGIESELRSKTDNRISKVRLEVFDPTRHIARA
jgi:Replication initiator protein A